MKFRIKEIIYSNGSKEYKIQKKELGLFWITCHIYKVHWTFNNTHDLVLDTSRDTTYEFIVNNKKLALDCIKWLTSDSMNQCFYDDSDNFLFGFLRPGFTGRYYTAETIEEIYKMKNEVYPSKCITSTNFIYYNKKEHAFYQN